MTDAEDKNIETIYVYLAKKYGGESQVIQGGENAGKPALDQNYIDYIPSNKEEFDILFNNYRKEFLEYADDIKKERISLHNTNQNTTGTDNGIHEALTNVSKIISNTIMEHNKSCPQEDIIATRITKRIKASNHDSSIAQKSILKHTSKPDETTRKLTRTKRSQNLMQEVDLNEEPPQAPNKVHFSRTVQVRNI